MVLREASLPKDLEMPLPGRSFGLGKGSQDCCRKSEVWRKGVGRTKTGAKGDLGQSTVTFSETRGQYVDVTFSESILF